MGTNDAEVVFELGFGIPASSVTWMGTWSDPTRVGDLLTSSLIFSSISPFLSAPQSKAAIMASANAMQEVGVVIEEVALDVRPTFKKFSKYSRPIVIVNAFAVGDHDRLEVFVAPVSLVALLFGHAAKKLDVAHQCVKWIPSG